MSQLPLSRRAFVKTVSVAGVGWWCGSGGVGAQGPRAALPVRPFGKSGVKLPILGLSGPLDWTANLPLLRQAFEAGVAHWDSAPDDAGGKSEQGIGQYLQRYMGDRPRIFLATKSTGRTALQLDELLHKSLSRMQTQYVDWFCLQDVSRVDELTAEIKMWAAQAKAQRRIGFFGFSTHTNVAACLTGAVKLGWVDGIQLTYNYRLAEDEELTAAMAAAAGAGIGLTTADPYGLRPGLPGNSGTALLDPFVDRGFSVPQAKLKVVWENPHITTACVNIRTPADLKSCVAAALDKSPTSGPAA